MLREMVATTELSFKSLSFCSAPGYQSDYVIFEFGCGRVVAELLFEAVLVLATAIRYLGVTGVVDHLGLEDHVRNLDDDLGVLLP